MASKPETLFRGRVVAWMMKSLSKCHHLTIQQMARRGDPDMVLSLNGYFLAIELKAEEGTATELQKHILGKIRMSGSLAMVVKPSTWPECQGILKQIDQGEPAWANRNQTFLQSHLLRNL